MEVQSELLLYLDLRRILLEMKNHSEDFVHRLDVDIVSKSPPFRYFLEIDVMDLSNFSSDLSKLLLEEPLQFKVLCNKILYASLQSTGNEITVHVNASQVAVILRLKSTPRILFHCNTHSYKGLNYFQGVLLEISKPSPCVYHTVWSCPEECEGNEVILQYIPKIPPRCYICKSVLFENSGLRRCSEQVTATFKIQNQLLPKKFKLTEDFFSKLKLGSEYCVTAIILKTTTDVCSLEVVLPLPAPITMAKSTDIDELFDACDGLPWKFIYCLASSIGVSICPLHCYIHLKINLLLSLTSVKANLLTGSNIIHVLAAGLDSSLVGALMEEGRKLANVSITLGTAFTTVSTALISAMGGICIMPLPFHTYNQKLTSAVLSTIESGEIIQDSIRTKLRTAVWAQGMDFKKTSLTNVASVFGTICRGDNGEYGDEINEFNLQRAIAPNERTQEEIQAMKDVEIYIDLVSGINVVLDTATETLLRSYFLAARREGSRGVTVGSMESLVTTCLNSARLCRRTTTTIHDAIFAIWLHVCGNPEPRFAPDEYLQAPADIKKLQKIFNNFTTWLEEFTGNCYAQN